LAHGTSPLVQGFTIKALSDTAKPETKKALGNMLEMQAATGMASALHGMGAREDTSSVLANTTLPVLIITSKNDNVISYEQSENMHKLAKNSTLVFIEDAGHLSSLENPKQWNDAVISWYSRLY